MTIEGKVAKILGKGEVVLNRGRSHGVKQGMTFELFAPAGARFYEVPAVSEGVCCAPDRWVVTYGNTRREVYSWSE